MNQEGANCVPLLRCTTDALDGLELQKLIISTQYANIELNIEYTVKRCNGHVQSYIDNWVKSCQGAEALHGGEEFWQKGIGNRNIKLDAILGQWFMLSAAMPFLFTQLWCCWLDREWVIS